MAYWLAEEHLSNNNDHQEYSSDLQHYFKSNEGGNRDVGCSATVYMVELDTIEDKPVLAPYTLCLLHKDAKSSINNSFPDNLEIRLYKLGASVSDYITINDFDKSSLIILARLSEFSYYGVKLGLVKETVVNKITGEEYDEYSFALFSNIRDKEPNCFTLECFRASSPEEPGFNLTISRKALDLTSDGIKIPQITLGGYTLNIPGDNINILSTVRLKELIFSVFCVGINKFDPSIIWRVEEGSNQGVISINVNNDEAITKANGSNKINIRKANNFTLNLTVDCSDRRDFLNVILKLDRLRADYQEVKSNTEILTKKRGFIYRIKHVRENLDHYDTALQVLEYL